MYTTTKMKCSKEIVEKDDDCDLCFVFGVD